MGLHIPSLKAVCDRCKKSIDTGKTSQDEARHYVLHRRQWISIVVTSVWHGETTGDEVVACSACGDLIVSAIREAQRMEMSAEDAA